MKEERFYLELKRQARAKGGDRYETKELVDAYNGLPLVIYLPQEVSRVEGIVVPRFTMTLEIG